MTSFEWIKRVLDAASTPPREGASTPPREGADAARATAAAIIAAGKMRRGELVDSALPAGSVAAAIVAAGKMRRSEL